MREFERRLGLGVTQMRIANGRERPLAGNHLVQGGAERIDVGPVIDLDLTTCLGVDKRLGRT